ncbi:unnamed protein product [Ilex paraguariensis]|uniref:Uncharacterized protein n=1 Tax=Ilex paraguariensis TaxID=185542 RepID=A0ABC8RUZ8_9AQUA
MTMCQNHAYEGELSSTFYHDLFGQHAIFAEHTAVSSANHPCPYIAYFGPVHPSSSNSSGNVSDGSNFNNQWSVPSAPTMDVHYHGWERHSSPFPTMTSRIGGADQPLVPSVIQRATRANSDVPRSGSFLHPSFVGHSSTARAGSSVSSSMIPPYPGSVARARDRVQALQAYFQQPSNSVAVRTPANHHATRRSSSHRSLAQVGPVVSSSDQTSGFVFSPLSSSERNFQAAENPVPNRFHAWEREHLPSFPQSQADRDPGWGPFHQAAGGYDSGIRSNSFRQRHGSERMPSHNRS